MVIDTEDKHYSLYKLDSNGRRIESNPLVKTSAGSIEAGDYLIGESP